MQKTLTKIGDGTDENPFRPDIEDGISWQMVEERETEYVIEILE